MAGIGNLRLTIVERAGVPMLHGEHLGSAPPDVPILRVERLSAPRPGVPAFASRRSSNHHSRVAALSVLLLLPALIVNGFFATALATTSKNKTTLVSIAPSNTELIYSLGADDQLVGVSTYCKYPAEAEKKPKAGSFVSIDFERLARLKPDIVLLVEGQEPLSIQLKKHGIKSLVLHNKTLADIGNNVITLGTICGKQERAQKLSSAYAKAITDLKTIVKGEHPPSILLCVWPKPIVTVGGDSFLNDVVTTCGALNVAAGVKTNYPKLSAERLIASQPEIVVLPYQARGTSTHTKPPWSLLSAIKNKHYFYLPDPDDDFLSRPTLRILKGVYWLSVRIHPNLKSTLKSWLAENEKQVNPQIQSTSN